MKGWKNKIKWLEQNKWQQMTRRDKTGQDRTGQTNSLTHSYQGMGEKMEGGVGGSAQVRSSDNVRVSMWFRKGCHVLWNFSREPLRENLIFSSLRQYRISWIHLLCAGGEGWIHLRRINLLASKVVKAMIRRAELDTLGIRGIPKRAVRGSGSNKQCLIQSEQTFPFSFLSRIGIATLDFRY